MKKLLTLPVFIILLTGCGNPHQLTYKSGDMTETLSEGKSAIPDEFKDYIFPGATTPGSVSAEGENSEESKFLMLSCSQPISTVSKWYQDKLKSSNWKKITVDEQPKLISLVGHKDRTEINVRAEAEDKGTTSISLSIENQVEDSSNSDETNQNYSPNKTEPPTD